MKTLKTINKSIVSALVLITSISGFQSVYAQNATTYSDAYNAKNWDVTVDTYSRYGKAPELDGSDVMSFSEDSVTFKFNKSNVGTGVYTIVDAAIPISASGFLSFTWQNQGNLFFSHKSLSDPVSGVPVQSQIVVYGSAGSQALDANLYTALSNFFNKTPTETSLPANLTFDNSGKYSGYFDSGDYLRLFMIYNASSATTAMGSTPSPANQAPLTQYQTFTVSNFTFIPDGSTLGDVAAPEPGSYLIIAGFLVLIAVRRNLTKEAS